MKTYLSPISKFSFKKWLFLFLFLFFILNRMGEGFVLYERTSHSSNIKTLQIACSSYVAF